MEELLSKWNLIKETAKKEHDISDVAYRTWILPLEISSVKGNIIFILIPDEQSQGIDYISNKYKLPLKVAAEEITGKEYDIEFILEKNSFNQNNSESYNGFSSYNNSGLNPKYTFDTFVVGKNNQFAHSAALAVAENPGQNFNPLFLYGGPGVGKTHLMHAIGHYILSKDRKKNVLYVTSETFTNELIESIKTGNQAMIKFREKYRTVDVLLLDDIQFIIGKESTQEEFFHTFNELHSANKAIIISSDKPPKDIETLEERLKSRFDMGLTADINPPDYETRAAILRKYAENYDINITNDVIDYVANNIKSNIRELEGAFNKLVAMKMNNSDLTIEAVKNQISDYIIDNVPKKITMDMIINEVSKYYNISVEDINSKKRNQELVHPRQVAMYLCRELTDNSQDQIGKTVGNRDHSTVINSLNKINDEIVNKTNTVDEIEDIKKKLL